MRWCDAQAWQPWRYTACWTQSCWLFTLMVLHIMWPKTVFTETLAEIMKIILPLRWFILLFCLYWWCWFMVLSSTCSHLLWSGLLWAISTGSKLVSTLNACHTVTLLMLVIVYNLLFTAKSLFHENDPCAINLTRTCFLLHHKIQDTRCHINLLSGGKLHYMKEKHDDDMHVHVFLSVIFCL